jgi:hypothetical protein
MVGVFVIVELWGGQGGRHGLEGIVWRGRYRLERKVSFGEEGIVWRGSYRRRIHQVIFDTSLELTCTEAASFIVRLTEVYLIQNLNSTTSTEHQGLVAHVGNKRVLEHSAMLIGSITSRSMAKTLSFILRFVLRKTQSH